MLEEKKKKDFKYEKILEENEKELEIKRKEFKEDEEIEEWKEIDVRIIEG